MSNIDNLRVCTNTNSDEDTTKSTLFDHSILSVLSNVIHFRNGVKSPYSDTDTQCDVWSIATNVRTSTGYKSPTASLKQFTLRYPRGILRTNTFAANNIVTNEFSFDNFSEFSEYTESVGTLTNEHYYDNNNSEDSYENDIYNTLDRLCLVPNDKPVYEMTLSKNGSEVCDCEYTIPLQDDKSVITRGKLNFKNPEENLSFEYIVNATGKDGIEIEDCCDRPRKKSTLIAWKTDVEVVEFESQLRYDSSPKYSTEGDESKGTDGGFFFTFMSENPSLVLPLTLAPLLCFVV